MKNYFFCVALFCLIACSSETEKSTESQISTETNEDIEENPEIQQKSSLDPEKHPCEFINQIKLASILNLEADQFVMEDDKRGQYCVIKTTEFVEENAAPIRLLYFDKMISKEGRPNFQKMMTMMINNNKMRIPSGPDKGKDVPTRKVEGIGDLAFVYSAVNFSTLVYHFNNEVRFTITLYRKLPDTSVPDGIEASTNELEEKLVEIAQSMH